MHIGTWPAVLRCRSRRPYLTGQSISGGRSIAGTSQAIASSAGYWRIDLAGVVIVDRRTLLAWRRIEGALEGRANTIDVAVCDVSRPYGISASDVPHDDDMLFDDDTPYTHDPQARLDAAASLRATTLTIEKLVDTLWFEGGETFSLEHAAAWGNRLYRVKAVTAQDETTATVQITPPLRAAIARHATVELATPRCRMRLADDEGMAAEIDLGRFAQPSVSFVEDI